MKNTYIPIEYRRLFVRHARHDQIEILRVVFLLGAVARHVEVKVTQLIKLLILNNLEVLITNAIEELLANHAG